MEWNEIITFLEVELSLQLIKKIIKPEGNPFHPSPRQSKFKKYHPNPSGNLLIKNLINFYSKIFFWSYFLDPKLFNLILQDEFI